MKRLTMLGLSLAMLAGQAQGQAMQYPAVQSAPAASSGQSSGSSVVPIVAIVGAVVTTGYILFRVHRVKQARKARFNIYVKAGN